MPIDLNETCGMSTVARLPGKLSDSSAASLPHVHDGLPNPPPSRESNAVPHRQIRTPCSPRVIGATATPPSTLPAMLARSLAAPRIEPEPMRNPGFPRMRTRRTHPGAAFTLPRTRDLIPNHHPSLWQVPQCQRASFEGAHGSQTHPSRLAAVSAHTEPFPVPHIAGLHPLHPQRSHQRPPLPSSRSPCC